MWCGPNINARPHARLRQPADCKIDSIFISLKEDVVKPPIRLTLITLAAISIHAGAFAQTGPSLLIQPWADKPQYASTYDEPMFIFGGHTKGDDEDIDILYYDSFGRVKFDRDNPEPNFWLGYRAMTIGIGGDQPGLPGDLNDISLAAAFRLGDGSGEWQLSIAGGAGTANDGHWGNSDAIYGIATINAAHRIDDRSALNIGINYNGNRTFLPDVPLPYLVYQHRSSKSFAYSLGVPTSGVTWSPTNDLTFHASYTVPTTILASVTYGLNKEWSIFGEYTQTLDGFYVEDQGDTRLFYEKSILAAGVRWIHEPLIDIRGGLGYAFDQRFSRGWDVRDLDSVAKPSDEMVLFFTVQGTF